MPSVVDSTFREFRTGFQDVEPQEFVQRGAGFCCCSSPEDRDPDRLLLSSVFSPDWQVFQQTSRKTPYCGDWCNHGNSHDCIGTSVSALWFGIISLCGVSVFWTRCHYFPEVCMRQSQSLCQVSLMLGRCGARISQRCGQRIMWCHCRLLWV